MRRTLRFLPLGLALALAAGLLTACGSNDSGQDTAKLLRETFSGDQNIRSGRLAVIFDVRAPGISGLPSPLRLELGGPFQSTSGPTPKFAFDLKLATQDGRVSVGAISTGTHAWLRIGQRAYALPDGSLAGAIGSGAAGSAGGSGISLQGLGIAPRRWLRDVRDEGTTKLDGDAVVHLAAGVKVPAMLEDVGRLLGSAGRLGVAGSGLAGALTPARRAQLARTVTGAQVDIWTGERDHRLRRLSLALKIRTPASRNGHVNLQLGITGQDRPQAIGPPANPRPLSELNAAIAVLRRGRSNGAQTQTPAASSAQGSSSGGAATSSAGDYDSCVAAAGSNIAAAQRCASLLGG